MSDAIDKAVADMPNATRGGCVCPMCGHNYPHTHTPEEITIFRNGAKFERKSAGASPAPEQTAEEPALGGAGQSEPVAEWRVGQKVRIEGEVGEIRRIDLEKQWAWVSWPDPLFANQYLSGWRSFSSFAAIGGAGQSPTDDTVRLNWLEQQVVNVRHPARYGSLDNFWSSPDRDDGSTDPSDLRVMIDAALRSTLPQTTGGKGS